MGSLAPKTFSSRKFVDDVRHVCEAVGAPFSETNTRQVLDVYGPSFRRGAVLWRITNRPGDAVNYRFYETTSTDTITPALEAGILDARNPVLALLKSWSALYEGSAEQSCDFDAEKGLAKAWVYLGGLRPLDDILDAEDVPDSVRRHRQMFKDLDLTIVRHVAVDYHSHTVNLYFRAPGPLSAKQAARYAALAGSPAPSAEEVEEMSRFLNPTGFTFSVTMAFSTGSISRVAFYALKLAPGTFPSLSQRLLTFFKEAPSYDEEEMNAIAWSFGSGGTKYIKAERSYCGELVPLMRAWNSAMSS
jgi:4-hydroxyphenylpyruvate 3-dimethylallyltransferase